MLMVNSLTRDIHSATPQYTCKSLNFCVYFLTAAFPNLPFLMEMTVTEFQPEARKKWLGALSLVLLYGITAGEHCIIWCDAFSCVAPEKCVLVSY